MKIKKEIRKILENYSESNKMNFKPELEVPSLELCKRLKELGFPQFSGGWYWVLEELTYKEVWKLKLLYNIPYAVDNLKIKAPTCRELGEWLPVYLEEDIYLDIDHPSSDVWIVSYIKTTHPLQKSIISFYDNTEPNVRAKMIIFLAENGHVKFEEGKGEG